MSTKIIMSTTYKRLINEYTKLDHILNHNNELSILIKNFKYKIFIMDHEKLLYKTIIEFTYNNIPFNVNIIYNKYYPFEPPDKIDINSKNINDIYKKIMNKNSDLFNNQCLCCKSLLCVMNWNIYYDIHDILDEIIKIINYKNLCIQRRLLTSIINKYCSNENMDYLHYYLL
jgi:ubiquitin-protein ligase